MNEDIFHSTPWEQMTGGGLYNASDKALLDELIRVRQKCFLLNSTSPLEEEKRRELLREIIPSQGEGLTVVSPFFCDYGTNIEIGDHTFFNMGCVILDEGKVRFGSHVFVGPQCGFYTACHPLDAGKRNALLQYTRPIVVGDNVWIGGGVKVMPGVSIGSGSVIGGGSVVVSDIPEGVIACGNPCRVVRKISPGEI